MRLVIIPFHLLLFHSVYYYSIPFIIYYIQTDYIPNIVVLRTGSPQQHNRRHPRRRPSETVFRSGRHRQQGEEVRDGAEHQDGPDEADASTAAAGNDKFHFVPFSFQQSRFILILLLFVQFSFCGNR